MSNQELIDAGMKTMDETDQVIERSKKVYSFMDPFSSNVSFVCIISSGFGL